MGRNRGRHRAVEVDDSDEESDPKIALALADLGNAARDRLTSHDIEVDRTVSRAQLERVRKCNQPGSAEGQSATLNKAQLSGWNTFGGADSTTNLDDIAGGQYHRFSTSVKNEELISQLQKQGKVINAETVDDHLYRKGSTHNGASYDVKCAKGRAGRFNSNKSTRGGSLLDPAVDLNHGNKNNKKNPAQGIGNHAPSRPSASVRGGRTGRDVFRSPRKAHSNTNVSSRLDPALHGAVSVSSKTVSPAEIGPRIGTIRSRMQVRPWPPAALAGNEEPTASSDTINFTSPLIEPNHLLTSPSKSKEIRSQKEFKTHLPQATLAAFTPVPSKLTTPIHADTALLPGASASRASGPASLAFDFSKWAEGVQALQISSSRPSEASSVKHTVRKQKGSNHEISNPENLSDGRRTLPPVFRSPNSGVGVHHFGKNLIWNGNNDVENEPKAPQRTPEYLADTEDLLSFEISPVRHQVLQLSETYSTKPSAGSRNPKALRSQNQADTASDGSASPPYYTADENLSLPAVREPLDEARNVIQGVPPLGSKRTNAENLGRNPGIAFTHAPRFEVANVARGNVVSTSTPAVSPSHQPTGSASTLEPAIPAYYKRANSVRASISSTSTVQSSPTILSSSLSSGLGDCSSRARVTTKPARRTDLTHSRYAFKDEEAQRPKLQPVSAPQSTGLDILLRDMANVGVAVIQNRRPDQPAIAGSTKSFSFGNRFPAQNPTAPSISTAPARTTAPATVFASLNQVQTPFEFSTRFRNPPRIDSDSDGEL